MRSYLITAATMLGLLLIVPLWVLGATLSWRRSWLAFRTYVFILGMLAGIGVGIGMAARL